MEELATRSVERSVEGRDESASCSVCPPNPVVSVATVQQQEWERGVDCGVAFDTGRETGTMKQSIVCVCGRDEAGVLLRVDELRVGGEWREDDEHVLSE